MNVYREAEPVRAWLEETRKASELRLNPVAFSDCAKWLYQEGRLRHESGRFFSIAGLRCKRAPFAKHRKDLIMVDQPEIGWLAFIVRPGREGIEWLAQAKTEPGNVGETHLAPSVQATRSNFQRAHRGRPTEFIDLLLASKTFASDSPHSEQGSRFLWKFNRNSILVLPREATPDLSTLPHWSWCTSAALREVLADDFRVNTDGRSVIATAPWSLLCDGKSLFSAEILDRSYCRRISPDFERVEQMVAPVNPGQVQRWQPVPLDSLAGWTMTDHEIHDEQGRKAVTCYEVRVKGREVDAWCQPFLVGTELADHALFMRVTDLGAEFFVRVSYEVGLGTRREFGPSLHSAYKTPDDMSGWDDVAGSTELAKIVQSDEGGRFMHANAIYRIVLVQSTERRAHYPFGRWVSLSELERLATQPGKTTNELRSLVSLILSHRFDQACVDA